MKTAWAVSLLLAGSAALAAGFSPADLQKAAQTADTSVEKLTVATEQLRLAIAIDPAAAIGMRQDAERPLLAAALGTGPGRGDARARWFMAGAIVQSVTPSTVTLYNPLARGWLTIGWRNGSDGRPAVVSVRTSSSGSVQWTEAQGSYLGALAADYAASRSVTGTQPASIAVGEMDRWLTDVADWQQPALQRAADSARQLIIAGRTHRSGNGMADMLPQGVRASFIPEAAFRRKDGGRSLLFGSPLVPSMKIAADFDAADAPALQQITFMNLENAGDRS